VGPRTLISRYRWVLGRLRGAWRPVLVFELWLTLILLGTFVPASAWLLDRLVASSGQYAIADHDLLAFAFTPRGLVFLLLTAGLALALWAGEKAGLLVIARGAGDGGPTRVGVVLWKQVARVPALLRLGLLQAAAYIALAVPFALAALLAVRGILSDLDFYFYLNVRPARWWVAVGVAGGLTLVLVLLAAMLYVRWVLAVPVLVFEGAAPLGALRQSWGRTRGRVLTFAVPLATCWVGVIVAAMVSTWVMRSVAALLIARLETSIGVLIPVVAIALLLIVLVDAVLVIGGKLTDVMLTASLYREDDAARFDRRDAGATPSVPRLFRVATWTVAVIVVGIGVAASVGFVERTTVERDVAVTGHRGTKVRAPENTLSALRVAIDEGADFAEIDVQTTRDGVVVLLHDADLMRVASDPRRLEEIDHAALREIDVGSWFDPAFADERVPTLEEAIALARGRIRLNIELKLNRDDPALTRRVIEIVHREDFGSSCVISSLSFDAVTEARRLAPDIPVGLIVFQSVGNPTRMDADFLSMSAARVDRGLVRDAHRRGRAVHVWTVNDLNAVLAMLVMGVDNIITDEPRRVRGWIDEWNARSDGERLAIALGSMVMEFERPEETDP
jgi:glycerophosphoryl diester phosphodiesterase